MQKAETLVDLYLPPPARDVRDYALTLGRNYIFLLFLSLCNIVMYLRRDAWSHLTKIWRIKTHKENSVFSKIVEYKGKLYKSVVTLDINFVNGLKRIYGERIVNKDIERCNTGH